MADQGLRGERVVTKLGRALAGAGVTTALLVSAPAAGANPLPVKSAPVSFQVSNVNRSGLSCASDGRDYVLRGRIVGPEWILAAGGTAPVTTLYLHEFSFGKFFWNFTANPTYDYASAMAEAGHVSVVIDRLGYDESPRPAGRDVCIGAHADMARQTVAQLKEGSYASQLGADTPSFDQVLLAGHSVGAAAAELAAWSFQDIGIAGLITFAWADRDPSARSAEQSLAQSSVCARGGEESDPGQAGGYAYFGQGPDDFKANVFHDAEPSVVATATAQRNRDPCGDASSLTPAAVANARNVKAINAPVLLLFGRNDAVFTANAPQRQKELFTGSDDVSLETFANTGHAMTLERSAPDMRAAVSNWLVARKLVAPPFSGPLVRVSKRAVRMSLARSVPLRVSCAAPRGLVCKGEAILTRYVWKAPSRRGKATGRSKKTKKQKKIIRVGRKSFTAAAGTSRTVRVRPSLSAARIIRSRGKLRVTGTVRAGAQGLPRRTVRKRFDITRPKRTGRRSPRR